MNIGFISDLHIDINAGYGVKEALARVCHEKNITQLYIAGDISNSAVMTLDFIDEFYWKHNINIFSIFGNHDYYDVRGDFNEMRELAKVFPIILPNGMGIMGDTGWYDYSWAMGGATGKIRKGKTPSGSTWPDHRFIKWPDDVEGDPACWFTKQNIISLNKQNDWLNLHNVEKKIVMLHMVPHYTFLEQGLDYRYTNAFFGSEPIANFLDEVKPEYCFFGHTHFTRDIERDGTHYICRPLGYADAGEWGNRSAYERIDMLMYVMEIN